jgi:hypothetical protein
MRQTECRPSRRRLSELILGSSCPFWAMAERIQSLPRLSYERSQENKRHACTRTSEL